MGEVATALASIKAMQSAWAIIYSAVAFNAYQLPPLCAPLNGSSYDFIVVGGGSAGSVVASRLTENSNVSVLLIEAGGYPPIQSQVPSTFPSLALSDFDYQYPSVNDNYTAQNLQGGVVSCTQGKGLGGTGMLQHMMYEQSDADDFQDWKEIIGDDTWDYENILPYFIKQEFLYDTEILNSSHASYHGTSGPMKIARESHPDNADFLSAAAQLGHQVKLDLSGEVMRGFGEPLFNIADDERVNNALAYLRPAKDRTNLCLSLNSTATKIIFENGIATGIQMIDSDNNTIVVNANKEVIISAGAFNTPKLMMLSGVGPKALLESLNIETISDLPVGQNLQDNLSTVMVYKMKADTSPAPATSPYIFPVPTTVGIVSLNSTDNSTNNRSVYQTVNMLFPHDSTAQISLCGQVFKYKEEICQTFYDASKGATTLFSVPYLLKPESRGYVEIKSADPMEPPVIHTGVYSNSSDLTLLAKCLADHNRFLDTDYFKSINATFVDPGVCPEAKTEAEYWECYALKMSATTWHYCGTASMGPVLTSKLKVKGVDRLRVVDSSSMPRITVGKVNTVITALAERAAVLIQEEWGLA